MADHGRERRGDLVVGNLEREQLDGGELRRARGESGLGERNETREGVGMRRCSKRGQGRWFRLDAMGRRSQRACARSGRGGCGRARRRWRAGPIEHREGAGARWSGPSCREREERERRGKRARVERASWVERPRGRGFWAPLGFSFILKFEFHFLFIFSF